MPIKRRMDLLNWAREDKNRYIIEDDYDSEFRFEGRPIPSLQSLDNDDKVIYLGTLSKAFAPSIRVAYMVLPKSLIKIYRRILVFMLVQFQDLPSKLYISLFQKVILKDI